MRESTVTMQRPNDAPSGCPGSALGLKSGDRVRLRYPSTAKCGS